MNTITVISTYKLAPTELKVVQDIAKTKLGASGSIKNVIDKSVIAGVKIQAEGREIDFTVSGSLYRLAGSLT
ncbi:MAG: F0F1 ATP synthase subunit delta [bacterium]